MTIEINKTLSKIIDWFLVVLMIGSAIYLGHQVLTQPKIIIIQDKFSNMCVSEYDYRERKVCMFYAGQEGMKKMFNISVNFSTLPSHNTK